MAKKEIKKLTLKNFDYDEFYDSIRAFYYDNQHLMVPYDFVDFRYEIGYPLGQAVEMLRTHQKMINDVQHVQLNKMGFVWNPKFLFEYKDFYNRVKTFMETHKTKYIKEQYKDPDGYPLGKKVQMVKNGYLVFYGKTQEDLPKIMLSDKQYKEITKLGLALENKHETFSRRFARDPNLPPFVFEEFVAHFKDYAGELNEQTVFVPAKTISKDGYPLGRFSTLLRDYKREFDKSQKITLGLTKQHFDKLEDMGFAWRKFYDFDFDEFVQHLQQYKDFFGHLDISEKYEQPGYKLGKIATNVKTTNNQLAHIYHQKYVLTQEQIKTLDDMGFVWVRAPGNPFDFNNFYEHFIDFKNTHEKDAPLPKKYVCEDGYALGDKASRIRIGRRMLIKGRNEGYVFTEEQYDMLDRAGFDWNPGTKKSNVVIVNKYQQEQPLTLTKKRNKK